MTYGTRYTFDWVSPMRQKYLYRVFIRKRGYSGDAEPLYPTGDCITLKCGKLDDDELTPTKPSELTLSLLCRDEGRPYLELFTVDPFEYIVEIDICNDAGGFSCSHFWRGYLAAGSYTEPYAKPPYTMTLKAVDGLALLKNIPFADANGQRHTGMKSLREIIQLAIESISDGYYIYGFDLPKIRPMQLVATETVVGLNCDDIYSKYGDNASCYDVLEGVLRSFGAQIYMHFGNWRIRSIAGLARNKALDVDKLYGADGQGLASSAEISLLPPYNKMTISRDNATTPSATQFGFLDHQKWRRVFHTFAANIWSGDDFLRMKTSQPWGMTSGTYSGFAWSPSVRFERADNMTLNVSVEAYNLRAVETRFRMGIFLEDSAAPAMTRWIGSVTTGEGVNNTAEIKGWNANTEQWVALPKGATTQRALLANYTTEFTIEPSKRTSWFNERTLTKNLSSATCSITTNGIPELATTDAHLVVVIVGVESNALPPIMLMSPELNVGNADDSQPQNVKDEIVISGLYTEDIEYRQDCQDSYTMPNAANALSLPLLNMATGKVVTSIISPNLDSSLAAAIARDIIDIRGRIAMQLQGELSMPRRVTFESLMLDTAGRIFYVNYIKYLTKRGIYDVQLRELPSLNPIIAVNDIDVQWSIEAVVAFDTSAILLDQAHGTVYHFDELTGNIRTLLVADVGEMFFMRAGINAACVCSITGTSPNKVISLRAYDSTGAVISHIPTTDAVIHVAAQSSSTAAGNAQYDATAKMWTTIVNTSALSIYTSMFDAEGVVIADGSDTTAAVLGAKDFTIMPNGYTYTSTRVGSTYTVSLWHSYSIHAPLATSTFETYTEIVAVNSVFIVVRKAGKFYVYERIDAAMSYSEQPLVEVPTTNRSFLAMNNALVVFKTAATYIVYDARVNSSKVVQLPATASDVWLSGDRLYYGRAFNGKYRISYITLS